MVTNCADEIVGITGEATAELRPPLAHHGQRGNALKAARGKYIAGCGGDDYWHNHNKMQMQVKFLEENPDYGMVLGMKILSWILLRS